MIPKSLEDNHIKAAAKEIDLNGIPVKRNSTKYLVQIGEALYPPKYIISLAVKHMSGQDLGSGVFDASEARAFLRKKNYKIITK